MTMSIPKIAPYQPDPVEDLPINRASWKPEPDRAAVLVHDMQRYFLRPFDSCAAPLSTVIVNVSRTLEWARRRAVPVYFTAQRGDATAADRGLQADIWGSGMSAEPSDTEIPEPLAPKDSEPVLRKWRYSAFHRTELADLLRGAHRDQLIICGVYAHLGCLVTAIDAYSWDIQPFMLADAVADFSADRHREALRYVAHSCGVVMTTDGLVEDGGA